VQTKIEERDEDLVSTGSGMKDTVSSSDKNPVPLDAAFKDYHKYERPERKYFKHAEGKVERVDKKEEKEPAKKAEAAEKVEVAKPVEAPPSKSKLPPHKELLKKVEGMCSSLKSAMEAKNQCSLKKAITHAKFETVSEQVQAMIQLYPSPKKVKETLLNLDTLVKEAESLLVSLSVE